VSGFSFSHLSGPQVLDGYTRAKASKCASDALLLAYLGEIDARKLFVEAGYPSMYSFVAVEFDFTDDLVKKRMRAARAAYEYPRVFPMLSDGRLSLGAFLLLVSHLNHGNADDLLSAANKTCLELERSLAARFPNTELMSWTMGRSPSEPATSAEQNRQTEGATWPLQSQAIAPTDSRPQVPPEDPGTVIPPLVRAPLTRITPIAANAHGVQFMMDDDANSDFEYLRAALGHEAPTVAHVFARALKALRREVDKRRSAATDRPQRPRRRISANPRRIANHVRRAAWKRDQCQCAFVSEDGRRCNARSGLEVDHIVPVARGGKSTVENLRLLCRAYNQHAAERAFGAEFMNGKREAAQRLRDELRAS
jgi:5-methylcytosine-specific restriction endonuclease McrA